MESENSQQQEKSKKIELSPSDFLFGCNLGEGSYARVIHARMKNSTGNDFAIKIMEKSHIKKENKVKYVLMEKNILSKISHPFVVKFYFSFQDQNCLYMCMDLAAGGELLSYIQLKRKENENNNIQNTALDISSARFYSSEILDALEYLHRREIVHRDLKPENVLISSSGHAKITDFGTALVACPFDQERPTGPEEGEEGDEESRSSFVGTAEYVSPELLHNLPVTRGCDLWALGCIIFQLLVGHPPFRAASEYLTFQTIMHHEDGSEPLQYPSNLDSCCQDIIGGLLQSSLTTRYGAGKDGESNDMSTLKNHEFFGNLNWKNLLDVPPPFVPDASRFLEAENMRDGASDDWLLEGEATVVDGDDDDLPMLSKSPPSKSLRSKSFGAQSVDMTSLLEPNENQVFTGIIYKKKGLFSKKRQLVLTDKPRLVYFDPDTMEMKGFIPWSSEYPVSCEILSSSSFDVICSKTGRRYHLTDSDAGSRMWVDLINAMLERQLEGEIQNV